LGTLYQLNEITKLSLKGTYYTKIREDNTDYSYTINHKRIENYFPFNWYRFILLISKYN